MKIKIIDLLVKVANGEEAPENIEYDNKVMKYDHNKQDYKGYYSNGNGDYLFQFLFDKCRNTEHFINDYVEIIEEPKKIEKWGEGALEEMEKCTDYTLEDLQKYIRILAETQNELIDEINNLCEKHLKK